MLLAIGLLVLLPVLQLFLLPGHNLLLLLLQRRLLLLTEVKPLLTMNHGYREVLFLVVGVEVD